MGDLLFSIAQPGAQARHRARDRAAQGERQVHEALPAMEAGHRPVRPQHDEMTLEELEGEWQRDQVRATADRSAQPRRHEGHEERSLSKHESSECPCFRSGTLKFTRRPTLRTSYTQVVDYLRDVNRMQPLDRLHLEHQSLVDKQVDSLLTRSPRRDIESESSFPLECANASERQLHRDRTRVHPLEQSRPKLSMDCKTAADCRAHEILRDLRGGLKRLGGQSWRFVIFVSSWFAVLADSPKCRPVKVRTSIDRPSVSSVTAPSSIGPEDRRADVAVALQHVRCGMAEVVGPAGAEHGDLWTERAHERHAARRQAAVMRNLHHAQRRRSDRRRPRSTALPISRSAGPRRRASERRGPASRRCAPSAAPSRPASGAARTSTPSIEISSPR